jgi:predicted DNA-binding ribbon-helix-helix protein
MSEICRREFCTPHDVCSYVAEHRHGSLTSSLRVFILGYFRTSATEEGHRKAGHGQGIVSDSAAGADGDARPEGGSA